MVGKATSTEQVAIERVHPWEEIEIVDAIDIVQSAQVITAHVEWRYQEFGVVGVIGR